MSICRSETKIGKIEQFGNKHRTHFALLHSFPQLGTVLSSGKITEVRSVNSDKNNGGLAWKSLKMSVQGMVAFDQQESVEPMMDCQRLVRLVCEDVDHSGLAGGQGVVVPGRVQQSQ